MAHLQQVATDLWAAGVIDIMAQEVRATWTANLERYEPRELGDNPAAVGVAVRGKHRAAGAAALRGSQLG